MIGLIDADIVCYRAAASAEEDEEWVAVSRADESMIGILMNARCTQYQTWLSDSDGNYRVKLYPSYKAGRRDRPRHLDATKRYLMDNWNARIARGQEADDALGINQSHESIICSIDKDLDQIPGHHYNWVKKAFYEVSPEEGVRMFYKQLLMGDITDNVCGLKQIGEKKSSAIIDPLTNEEEMYVATVKAYIDNYKKYKFPLEYFYVHLLNTARMVKIRTTEEELWNPPMSLEEVLKQLSLSPLMEKLIVSLEPTIVEKNMAGFQLSGNSMENYEKMDRRVSSI